QVHSRRVEKLELIQAEIRRGAGGARESGDTLALPRSRQLTVQAGGSGAGSHLNRAAIVHAPRQTDCLEYAGSPRDARGVRDNGHADTRSGEVDECAVALLACDGESRQLS